MDMVIEVKWKNANVVTLCWLCLAREVMVEMNKLDEMGEAMAEVKVGWELT